jgi:hypothetical protein
MCKLVNFILGDNWDALYFLNCSTKLSFGKVIHDMYKANNFSTCYVHIDGTFIPLDST